MNESGDGPGEPIGAGPSRTSNPTSEKISRNVRISMTNAATFFGWVMENSTGFCLCIT